jgi:hypothetical protein
MSTCCISIIILYTNILLRYIYYTVGIRMSVKRKVAYYLYNIGEGMGEGEGGCCCCNPYSSTVL